jgi:23S rRNA G2445 N2-methylase RlmL
LERDYLEQLGATFDVRVGRPIPPTGGTQLTPVQAAHRVRILAAIQRKCGQGMSHDKAIESYLRDACSTTVNRYVALKMLEARNVVQECVSEGEASSGYAEFCLLAPGIASLPNSAGYRLYLECLFDELSTEIKVLFDRRDPAAILWPRRAAFVALLETLNDAALSSVWGSDETIGWVYQYFNSVEERQAMRGDSPAPRDSYELAVRNQFFTPRYVVEFLVDNTLGRTWIEMHPATALRDACRYFVATDHRPDRAPKDPRDLRVLDPACGSGHFLLYAFDLLATIYREAWEADWPTRHGADRQTLRQAYPDRAALDRAVPALIAERNLHGVDIDARAAQIAAFAIWLRAQRAWVEADVTVSDRPRIRRTGIVVAEPMPGDAAMVTEFARTLRPPLLGNLFRTMVDEMRLAADLGTLLKAERTMEVPIREAGAALRRTPEMLQGGFDFATQRAARQGKLDLTDLDESSLATVDARLVEALHAFAGNAAGADGTRRRLFRDDAAQGVALIEAVRARYDVVLMNPPFGEACLGEGGASKRAFEAAYPRTKNNLYAAFVERGIDLLTRSGYLGAITSRTGFFKISFKRWREEIILTDAPPILFIDLGYGVMDEALVEAAAYCLIKK